METDDHERLARELDEEAEKLERQSAELEGKIDKTRSDWRAKQDDPGVPGAVTPRDAGEDPRGPGSGT